MSSSAGPAGSVPTPPPRVRQRLFNYVVMVALRQCRRDPTATTIVKPHLRYRFPPMSEAASTSGDNARARRQQCVIEEDRKLYKSVKKFCFPDLPPDLPLSTFMSSHATSYGTHEETFSFTLTESDGSKRWGYCLRWPGPVQAPFPQCICIISSLPCFSIFSSILRELTALQKVDPGLGSCFFTRLHVTTFLFLHIPLRMSVQHSRRALYFSAPSTMSRCHLPAGHCALRFRVLFSPLWYSAIDASCNAAVVAHAPRTAQSPPSYQQQPQVKQIAGTYSQRRVSA